MQKLTNMEYIVQFFLNLFRLQLGSIDQDKEAEAIPLALNDSTTSCTYELRAKRHGDWKSRRMTIEPIGGNVESRSMCYKVLYDDVLVVKIPPCQISSFGEYMENIKRERSVLQRLFPVVRCISPTVSAVLKRIPPFNDKKGLSSEELEKEYIKALRKNRDYQSHLKIGNTFVFFMELSKYPFLSDVIEKMHNIDSKVQNDILENAVALRDLDEFEAIYGSNNSSIFFGMHAIYNDYEAGVNQLAEEFGIVDLAPTYKVQQWFAFGLDGKDPASEPNTFPSRFIEDRNKLLRRILKEKKKHIETFRKATTAYVSRKNFVYNRRHYREIISNILDLICRLRQRGVAIRDLKPDNIFVERNPEERLSRDSSRSYPLGLIDFETAVIFTEKHNELSEQPPLAGTPCYSTPSHLFENRFLNQICGDLPRIMFLQDLFAALVIIFNVVTGRILFERTGKLIPEIMDSRKRAEANSQDLAEVFKGCNRIFWKSAVNEFDEIAKEDKGLLKSLKVAFPKTVSEMLLQEALKEKTILFDAFKSHVSFQKKFSKEKARHQLMGLSSDQIGTLRMNWERVRKALKSSSVNNKGAAQLLQDLKQIKRNMEINRNVINILNDDKPTMSVFHLMEFLFGVVVSSMSDEM